MISKSFYKLLFGFMAIIIVSLVALVATGIYKTDLENMASAVWLAVSGNGGEE